MTNRELIDYILHSEYERATVAQMQTLAPHYIRGTFTLQERRSGADYLFDEEQDFDTWLEAAVRVETNLISNDSHALDTLQRYGVDKLVHDVIDILMLQYSDTESFLDIIPNQIYSDVISRIIGWLLFQDPVHQFNTAQEFNNLGIAIIPSVLACLDASDLSLFEWFKMSQRAGVIGADYKDQLCCTSDINRQNIIPIGGSDSIIEKISRVYSSLMVYNQSGAGFMINDWPIFQEKVLQATAPIRLAWFTDDLIPSMFEMKFLGKLLTYNSNISVDMIPRSMICRNDITVEQMRELLTHYPIFNELREHYQHNRFRICTQGLDVGTFDGARLSKECADIMLKADYVFISGARSLEMGQGIQKPTFYIGVAVCRVYSETVTGISSTAGGLVMAYAENGSPVFTGFKDRATRRSKDPKTHREFPVAGMTILEYVKKRDGLVDIDE